MRSSITVAVLLAALVPGVRANVQAYLDTSLPFEKGAADLVSRMTLEEKVSQTGSSAPGIDRLGIAHYGWWNECLHGIVADGFTVFPQAIGLGATWDTDLMNRIGTAISDEARADYNRFAATGQGRARLDFWSPNVNIARDPRWGRNQETYGEDPAGGVTALDGERAGRGMKEAS